MTSLRRMSVVTVALLLGVASLAAQQTTPTQQQQGQGANATQDPQRGQRPAGNRAGRPGAQAQPPANPVQVSRDVQDMLDVLVLKQAQQALDLTDDQYVAFFKKMTELQRLRTQHRNQRQRLIAELNRLTQAGANTDDDTLMARTKAIDDLETGMIQKERDAQGAVDQALTPRQRARFRVFEENMEKQKLRLLAQVLQAGRGGTPPPAPEQPKVIK
jgi:hypothetical protein